MKKCCSEKQTMAEAALQISEDFHASLKDLRLKFTDLELKVMTDWVTSGLPKTCEADIIENDKIYSQVNSLKQALEEIKLKLPDMNKYNTTSDDEVIDRWICDLDRRVEELDVAFDDKQVSHISLLLESIVCLSHFPIFQLRY